MLAFRVISVFIFNGLSKLAHKRSASDGEPYLLPYPKKPPQRSVNTEQLGEMSANQPLTDESTDKKNDEVVAVIEQDDLFANEYELKQFLLRLEDEILKLIENTEEGIKVPRPVPYPRYLKKSPEIPVAYTRATVLRRLYNDEKIVRTVPPEVMKWKKFPKKPPVPRYSDPQVIVERKKSVKMPVAADDNRVVLLQQLFQLFANSSNAETRSVRV